MHWHCLETLSQSGIHIIVYWQIPGVKYIYQKFEYNEFLPDYICSEIQLFHCIFSL